MNKIFCCEKLSFFGRSENNIGLNFRVIKYEGSIREKMLLLNPKANDKGFVITSGYTNNIHDHGTTRMIIEYCPFCSQKLSDFYKSDNYVQEILS